MIPTTSESVGFNTSVMLNEKYQKVLSDLKERLLKEEDEYRKYCYDDRVKLSRTMLGSSYRKQISIMHKQNAIKTAIEILEKPDFRDVNVYEGVLLGLSSRRPDHDELLQKAESIYLNERKEACSVLFNVSLPIHRKEMLAFL